MKYRLTLYTEEYEDMFGHHDYFEKTFEVPFEFRQTVYYAYKKTKKKWVVLESKVASVWATNCFGIKLENGYCIDSDLFDRVFDNKEDAIDFCLKKNQQSKVKIYKDN